MHRQHYLEFLEKAQDESIKLDGLQESTPLITNSTQQNNHSIYSANADLADSDLTILNLIDDIENYLSDLRKRPTVSITNRVLSVIIISLSMLIYLGVEAFFIYLSQTIPSKGPFSLRDSYVAASICYGVFGGFVAVSATILTPHYLWNKEINITSHEWKLFIDRLQANILEKLKILEEKERVSYQQYLPTGPHNIRELEKHIKTLTERQAHECFTHTLPISQTITIFSRLKALLETIRQDLNLTKKPISLFFQPKVKLDSEADSGYDADDDFLPKIN